jgi:membrane protein implicated in regulation of membrane protease activity
LIWFILAALFAGAELLSGTFYLVLYGVSCAVGGIVALAGLGDAVSLMVAGVFGLAATFWLRKHPIVRPARTSGNGNLGQRVEVESWKTDTLLRVKHRGAGWDAELSGPVEGRPSVLYIIAQRGNTLILSDKPSAH